MQCNAKGIEIADDHFEHVVDNPLHLYFGDTDQPVLLTHWLPGGAVKMNVEHVEITHSCRSDLGSLRRVVLSKPPRDLRGQMR